MRSRLKRADRGDEPTRPGPIDPGIVRHDRGAAELEARSEEPELGPKDRAGLRADSLLPRRLRLLVERVVVERPRDDHWIDQPGDVLERAQAGGLDHGLAAATGSDDSGGRLVGPAVQVGAGRGLARVPLVAPGLLGAAGTASTRTDLARGGTGAARPLALGRGLFPRLPAHLSLEPPPLRRASGRFGPQLLRGLFDLLRDLRSLEVAPERRVGNLVVGGELPQGLTGRPAPNQLRVAALRRISSGSGASLRSRRLRFMAGSLAS